MTEWQGVLIALFSSALGGTAAAVTRYLVGSVDPLTLSILRWGISFVCVLPVALLLRVRWPGRADWPGVALLGFAFYGLFFILYNTAMGYTTAARASLALSTLPLQTMVVAALLGIERLSWRKTTGVLVAILGVCAALASGLQQAPAGAWRGELIMQGAVLCMAFYNVLSRPFIQRSSALGFLAVGMGSGAVALVVAGLATGSLAVLANFNQAQWLAGAWLGVAGGALAFILWVMALQRASPTRVANTMTINPIAAALLAQQLVGEPITLDLLVGLIAVFAGIWIATTPRPSPPCDSAAWPHAQRSRSSSILPRTRAAPRGAGRPSRPRYPPGWGRSSRTSRRRHATQLARAALAEGARRIVAVGGDGTVNEVLNGLLDASGRLIAPHTVLCPIPAGTGNELCRALGHLGDPALAYAAAASEATRPIDLLRVRCAGLDGRPVERFGYLIVSLGAAASISHRTSRSRWAKKLGGIAYLLMTPPVTLGYRNRAVAITVDGVPKGTRPIFTAMVANIENGGGMKLMPGARFDDGVLDLIEMGDIGPLAMLATVLPKVYSGAHIHHPKVRLSRGISFRFESTVETLVDLDGETVGRLALEVTVLPGACRVGAA